MGNDKLDIKVRVSAFGNKEVKKNASENFAGKKGHKLLCHSSIFGRCHLVLSNLAMSCESNWWQTDTTTIMVDVFLASRHLDS